MATLDRDTLEAALIGYEQQKQAIDLKVAQIRAQLNGANAPAAFASTVGAPKVAAPGAVAPKAKKGRRKFSAETRAKMAASQKRRWAAKHGAQ